jgi:hypothetical protein
MVTTRGNDTFPNTTLEHIAAEILQARAGDAKIRQALRAFGVTHQRDLFTLTNEDLETTWEITSGTPATTTTHRLNPVERRRILGLRKFYDKTDLDWLATTAQDLTDSIAQQVAAIENAVLQQASANSDSKHQKAMHRLDRISYDAIPELKLDANWTKWKRNLQVTTTRYGCDNVLDPTYVPSTADDIELFAYENTFVFVLLQTKCGSNKKASNILRPFSDENVQGTYLNRQLS